MPAETSRQRYKTLLAFGTIYFVWGSTFLAIRIGVHEVPPFLLAAIRFVLAGGALFIWSLARGERWPVARQWASAFLLGASIFILDYGLVFWAEQRVPSGLTAVMLSMNAVFMA
ncbi:MAG: EamA family transporter, partial [Terracidiphilus sp.]